MDSYRAIRDTSQSMWRETRDRHEGEMLSERSLEVARGMRPGTAKMVERISERGTASSGAGGASSLVASPRSKGPPARSKPTRLS